MLRNQTAAIRRRKSMRKVLFWIAAVSVTACSAAPDVPVYVVSGRVVAGPVCPVETAPPDPGCAPRPVEGAVIVAVGEDWRSEAVADSDGRFALSLPDGGYILEPQAVEGLMGTASPIAVEVRGGPVDVGELGYDTGIR
jgi:hypothetical protein